MVSPVEACGGLRLREEGSLFLQAATVIPPLGVVVKTEGVARGWGTVGSHRISLCA